MDKTFIMGALWGFYFMHNQITCTNLHVCLGGGCASIRYQQSTHWAHLYKDTATHMSSMLGSVNCTKRSLSCSTPAHTATMLWNKRVWYRHCELMVLWRPKLESTCSHQEPLRLTWGPGSRRWFGPETPYWSAFYTPEEEGHVIRALGCLFVTLNFMQASFRIFPKKNVDYKYGRYGFSAKSVL